jgi:hypothetical protein
VAASAVDSLTASSAAPIDPNESESSNARVRHWECVRWVNATANPATRQRRIEVSISKMNNGKRRPRCFDLSACTDPAYPRTASFAARRNSGF